MGKPKDRHPWVTPVDGGRRPYRPPLWAALHQPSASETSPCGLRTKPSASETFPPLPEDQAFGLGDIPARSSGQERGLLGNTVIIDNQ